MSNAQAALEQWVDEAVASGSSLDDIMAELAKLEEEPEAEAPRVRGFRIKDRANGDPVAALNLAQWALNKYREAVKHVADVDAAAAAQMAHVEAWRKHEHEKKQHIIDFFSSVLREYRNDFAPEEKTVALVGGKLKFRSCPDLISWDEDAAQAWAEQQDNADDLCPRKLAKSAVKSLLIKRADGTYALADTGEVVEFVRDVPPQERESFKVELA